jgi:hypothetical protein
VRAKSYFAKVAYRARSRTPILVPPRVLMRGLQTSWPPEEAASEGPTASEEVNAVRPTVARVPLGVSAVATVSGPPEPISHNDQPTVAPDTSRPEHTDTTSPRVEATEPIVQASVRNTLVLESDVGLDPVKPHMSFAPDTGRRREDNVGSRQVDPELPDFSAPKPPSTLLTEAASRRQIAPREPSPMREPEGTPHHDTRETRVPAPTIAGSLTARTQPPAKPPNTFSEGALRSPLPPTASATKPQDSNQMFAVPTPSGAPKRAAGGSERSKPLQLAKTPVSPRKPSLELEPRRPERVSRVEALLAGFEWVTQSAVTLPSASPRADDSANESPTPTDAPLPRKGSARMQPMTPAAPTSRSAPDPLPRAIHIGTIDVRIAPSSGVGTPLPPVAAPRSERTAPAAPIPALARGFTTSLGLRQG